MMMIMILTSSDFIVLGRKTAFDVTANVALQRPTVQNGTYQIFGAHRAVDGNLSTVSCTEYSTDPWLSIDLGAPLDVGRVCVVNDHDPQHG